MSFPVMERDHSALFIFRPSVACFPSPDEAYKARTTAWAITEAVHHIQIILFSIQNVGGCS